MCVYIFTEEEECNEDVVENSCHEVKNSVKINSLQSNEVGNKMEPAGKTPLSDTALSKTKHQQNVGRNFSFNSFFHHPTKTASEGNQICALCSPK